MNSEELELSLKSEFEDYLKNTLKEMRRESEEFYKRVEADLDKHRAQLDESFRSFSARFDAAPSFDEGFHSSVVEHLRLARDEGAKLAANAMAEAEELQRQEAVPPPAPKYDKLREAIEDISSKDSQAAILKSLVQGASEFASRGAFFIIKSEHFVGWKVFGTDKVTDAQAREIRFASSANSTLGAAVQALSTAEIDGSHAENQLFTEASDFNETPGGLAIPLVARGRGVAVLYVDKGEGGELNRDALEMLVRVAGLTVELLATSAGARDESKPVVGADFENERHESFDQPSSGESYAPSATTDHYPATAAPETTRSDAYSFEETPHDYSSPVSEFPVSNAVISDDSNVESLFNTAPEFKYTEDDQPADPYPVERPSAPGSPSYDTTESSGEPPTTLDYAFGRDSEPVEASPFQESSVEQPFASFQEPVIEDPQPSFGAADPVSPSPSGGASMVFDAAPDRSTSDYNNSPFQEIREPAQVPQGGGFSKAVEPSGHQAVSTAAPRTRLSDRPVDLPIDVPEEERRIHNDARRFARLLVSEIKLYNEKKVMEGRQSHDLYERLQEAIDRSREMYDKRVQPPVAAKFDYFHYELLNSLAEGSIERLGRSYPGASV